MTNPVKVTINPAPDAVEKIVNDGTVVVPDSLGRSLKIKPLDVLSESRLTRALGAEAAMNAAYMLGFVFPAASVCEIDGEEVAQPQTQREVDAAIQRLGREGITAVMMHFQSQSENKDEAEAAVKN